MDGNYPSKWVNFGRQSTAPEPEAIRFEHHPSSLALLSRTEGPRSELYGPVRKDMADFITAFHADLHLGDPVGLMLTGLLGLTLLASLITGIVLHRKYLREAFLFRPYRSFRLLLADAHKLMGLWILPFHVIFAFTGAFLGLAAVVLLPTAGYVSFNGDVATMIDTFLPDSAPERSGRSLDLRIAHVLESFQNADSAEVVSMTLLAADDQAGQLVLTTSANQGMVGEIFRFQLHSGELVERYTAFSRLGEPAGTALDLMFPLHFGNFGGLLVKILWALLGLGTALLSLTGMLIWLERRQHGPTGRQSPAFYQRIADLVVGCCAGLILATGALFPAQVVLMISGDLAATVLASVFFVSWSCAILWSLIRRNAKSSLRGLLLLGGALHLIAVPMALYASYSPAVAAHVGTSWTVAGVNAALVIAGTILVSCALWLPQLNRRVPRPSSLAPAGGH
ncbi:MAG: PepSY domain-containing protein [Halioglobus sp.]|nr:PepSY domain-containing protein [Halioglobus sp.]